MIPPFEPPFGAPVRQRDIAERLGVSLMTISLALRAHPSISKARIAEVKRTAREMGYRPNAMASALAHRKWTHARRNVATTLAWLNHWENPRNLRHQREFDLYWRGAAEAAHQLGYRLEEFIWSDAMPPSRLEKIFLTRNIQGIIIPPHPTPPDWTEWRFEQFSLVRIGHSVGNLPVHVISTDQVRGSLLAFRETSRRGYRRIGLVTSAWAERNTLFAAGFLLGQSQSSGNAALPMLRLEDASPEISAKDLSKLGQWIRRFRPDAILTDAGSVKKMLSQLKCDVPGEIGLAIFSASGDGVAGVNQNSADVGKMAVEILISQIHRNERGIPPTGHMHLVTPGWLDGGTLSVRDAKG
jgi:DNA-binding LacI/PurR family transcriptional regulator